MNLSVAFKNTFKLSKVQRETKTDEAFSGESEDECLSKTLI